MIHDMTDYAEEGKPRKAKVSPFYATREQQIGVVRADEKSAIADQPGFLTGNSEISKKVAEQNRIEREAAAKKVEDGDELYAMPDLHSATETVRQCATIENPIVQQQNAALMKRVQMLSRARTMANNAQDRKREEFKAIYEKHGLL